VERSGEEWFDFTPDTVLHIEGTDRVFPWGRIQAAHFDGHTLRATLVDEGPIEVPIESVRSVEMNNFSTGRTFALGVGLGVGTLFGLLVYGFANLHCHC
jgi:hypothetical protein